MNTEKHIDIVMLSSYAKLTPAPALLPPIVANVPFPEMVWLELKSIDRDLLLGSAKPPSLSLPLPVATKAVALTIPFTVNPESVPILEVVMLLLASLSAVIAPSCTLSVVQELELR